MRMHSDKSSACPVHTRFDNNLTLHHSQSDGHGRLYVRFGWATNQNPRRKWRLIPVPQAETVGSPHLEVPSLSYAQAGPPAMNSNMMSSSENGPSITDCGDRGFVKVCADWPNVCDEIMAR